jgi:hypothetical protein
MIRIRAGKILIPGPMIATRELKDKLGAHWFRQQRCWALYATQRTVNMVNDTFPGTGLEWVQQYPAQAIHFPFKTEPKSYQLEALSAGLGRAEFAYLMDPGLGKTKVVVDEAQILARDRRLNSVMVVCPKNAMGVWTDQIHKHGWSDDWSIEVWNRPDLRQDGPGLKWSVINKDALVAARRDPKDPRVMSEGLRWADERMTAGGATMLVIDESTDIAGPESLRTEAVLWLRRLSNYRRALNGTFIADKPLDAYSQLYFLDPQIVYGWSFQAYKSHFCHMGGFEVRGRPVQILGYRNLDELAAMIDSVAYKKTKDDVIGLPDKTYEKWPVVLKDRAKKAYNDIISNLTTELDNNLITADMVITKAIKLRQITGGSVIDDTGSVLSVGTEKLDALLAAARQAGSAQFLVWCAFRHEVTAVYNALGEAGFSVEQYHGDISGAGRDAIIRIFESGMAQALILQNDAGFRAITLNAASYAFIFSNPNKLDVRIQLEDRCHRQGQSKNVTYIDFIVEGSFDEVLLDSLKAKKDVADYIMAAPGEGKTFNVRTQVLRRLK